MGTVHVQLGLTHAVRGDAVWPGGDPEGTHPPPGDPPSPGDPHPQSTQPIHLHSAPPTPRKPTHPTQPHPPQGNPPTPAYPQKTRPSQNTRPPRQKPQQTPARMGLYFRRNCLLFLCSFCKRNPPPPPLSYRTSMTRILPRWGPRHLVGTCGSACDFPVCVLHERMPRANGTSAAKEVRFSPCVHLSASLWDSLRQGETIQTGAFH